LTHGKMSHSTAHTSAFDNTEHLTEAMLSPRGTGVFGRFSFEYIAKIDKV